jgi:hypothetical protein
VIIKPSVPDPSLIVFFDASWLLSVSSDSSRLLVIASFNLSMLTIPITSSSFLLVIPEGLIEIGKVHGQRDETQNTLFFLFVVS